MTATRRMLCACYAVIALAALVATWTQNIAYLSAGNGLSWVLDFARDTRSNPASRSITADIVLFALSAMIFMVLDARRLGVRYVWVYILGSFVTAISITFPLYLIARERRLAAAGDTLPRLPVADKVGLVAAAVATAAFTIWVDIG